LARFIATTSRSAETDKLSTGGPFFVGQKERFNPQTHNSFTEI
jgi:hypothetical protein